MAGQPEVVVREVGPRDGLQSLALTLPLDAKVGLLERLDAAGIRRVEAGSFVSARAVPQMADSDALFKATRALGHLVREALVVNQRGARRALAAGVDALVVVVAASESFSAANVRMSVAAAIDEVRGICDAAVGAGCPVVADVATAFGCAYEGMVPIDAVLHVVDGLAELGIREITLADTTGMGAPSDVLQRVDAVRCRFDAITLGLHFHNTRGLGLANVWAGLEAGVRLFDSSIGGMGGCPFSPGATGNIATEDLVHLLAVTGFETGIDLDRLIETANDLEQKLSVTLPGQVMRAGPRWVTKGKRA